MDSLQQYSNFVLFKTDEWKINIDVFFANETLRLTQEMIAQLYEKDRTTITRHINNIIKEWELDEKEVCVFFAHTTKHGSISGKTQTKEVKYYNLKMILSVWYRVNSHRAIEFRKWANSVLEEYIIKWYSLDDEKLKEIKYFWKDYFDDLLERIHEIRLSERRFYQKITDIYSLSADYDSQADITKHFFATVQNKLHRAITGRTAAEIIYLNADATKLHMGLKTWKHAPNWKILKSDTTIAKNYLDHEHISKLNTIVSAYLDMAEMKAKNQQVMNMKDWEWFLTQFLEISNYPILQDAWKISMLEAKIKAESEYEKFRVQQDKDYISDFDKLINRLPY